MAQNDLFNSEHDNEEFKPKRRLIPVNPEWKKEWKDMPDFIQEKQRPHAQIIFRFASEKDLQQFAKLIGQKLTKNTKSSWYPFKSHFGLDKKIWVDEDDKNKK